MKTVFVLFLLVVLLAVFVPPADAAPDTLQGVVCRWTQNKSKTYCECKRNGPGGVWKPAPRAACVIVVKKRR